jgi:signal transduction histidine kinase
MDLATGVAEDGRHMNAGILLAMEAPSDLDTLLAVPLVALLDEPRTAGEISEALSGDGLVVERARAERLVRRLTGLGLARTVAGHDAQPAYVATSLGRRLADTLVGDRPALAVALEELERLRSDLLATIGHELRTPLTSIRTSVGLLLDPGLSPTDEQRQQLLVTIARSSDRMQQLLSELLDFARLRSGGVEMQTEQLDARAVARDVALAIKPLVTARNQSMRLELPDEPMPLVADRRRLEQALLNLAGNAQKFTPSGGELAIRLAEDGDSVRWSVEDHGPGISAEEQARLFERFFVGARDRSGRRGGIGLGLPTALAIAQAHGGTIEVESQIGRGSTFTLTVARRRG